VRQLIEDDIRLISSAPLAPAQARIPDNGQQPCLGIPPFIPFKEPIRSQRCFLHCILGISVIAHQSARQIVGCIEMRRMVSSKISSLAVFCKVGPLTRPLRSCEQRLVVALCPYHPERMDEGRYCDGEPRARIRIAGSLVLISDAFHLE
jgi:hypothetical protein